MYFQKCTNCGHLNEVKSEYLTFCGKCNKKLENNFSEWHKINSDKTLNDFKQLYCISAEDMLKNVQATKKKAGMPTWLIVWIIVAALAVPTIGYLVYSHIGSIKAAFSSARMSKAQSDLLTSKWVKETYGGYGLTIETPAKLIRGDLPFPDNIRKLMKRVDVFQSDSSSGLKVQVISIRYDSSVGALNLQAGADGAVNNIKSANGVSDFKYTEEGIKKGDIPGIIQKGTYKDNLTEVEFMDVLFVKGFLGWQVVVIYQGNDDISRQAAKRVMDSIEITLNQ